MEELINNERERIIAQIALEKDALEFNQGLVEANRIKIKALEAMKTSLEDALTEEDAI